jgi:hypothetical protein
VLFDLGEALQSDTALGCLPILGILGLRARDVSYTFLVFLVLTPVSILLVILESDAALSAVCSREATHHLSLIPAQP